MKILKIFWKSLKEQARDWSTMSLSLIIGPFFVLLYWLMIPSGSTAYGVMVLNQDIGSSGADTIAVMETLSYASGDPLLDVTTVTDREEAETLLQDRDAEVLIIIPEDFSETLLTASLGDESATSAITLVGDLTNPYYAVGAIMASSAIDEYVQHITSETRPITIEEIALGASGGRSEFDLYVPGTGISLSTILLGIIALLLTFLVAMALGFESQGPIWAAMLIGSITAIAVVGVGLIVAAFSKTVSQAFIIANFPLIFFMFFSGAVFPLPRIRLFEVAGRVISLYDVIPSTHAVVALNKILTLGAGLIDVPYELVSLVVLSALYFAIGIWLFHQRHMRTA